MTDPRGAASAHLDAATIAAFVDRTLDSAARAAAEAHLAACADCREVWVETSELANEEAGGAAVNTAGAPAARSRSRRWILGSVGLTAAAALLAAGVWVAEPRPGRADLVEAARGVRRTEGRLAGGFEWGLAPTVARGQASSVVGLSEVARRVLDDVDERDHQSLADAGVALLMADEVSAAIASLERATTLAPHEASHWSDLTVAYLESYRLGNDAGAAQQAYEASTRALAIEPYFVEALFNHALSAEYAGFAEEAAAAWATYLAVDPDSPWAKEAARRRAPRRP